MSDGVVGWGAHRLGLASILGHDPHEIVFTCTFYCPLYMVWKDPSFLFQGQVMEHSYPQLARSTGHHHHSYWTALLIMVAVLEIGYRFYYQSFVRLFPIKIKYSQTILQLYVYSVRLWFQLY